MYLRVVVTFFFLVRKVFIQIAVKKIGPLYALGSVLSHIPHFELLALPPENL